MIKREEKHLECGCVVERYSETGLWWVHRLCKNHTDSYYENPKRYLRLMCWALANDKNRIEED